MRRRARCPATADVTSLYPSLMLQYRHAPAADRLGVFLKLLGDLRSFRVQAKALARELSGSNAATPTHPAHVQDSDQFVLRLPRIFRLAISTTFGGGQRFGPSADAI